MTGRYSICGRLIAIAATVFLFGSESRAQRLLGLDISAHQGNISQTTWNNIRNVENRQFVIIRSSRGGSTGQDNRQGGSFPGGNTTFKLSQCYDDPYFIQNVNRATTAGMFVGSYHRSRADVLASTVGSDGIPAGADNNGTDEANHMMEMAGMYMRPGYLPPVLDFEDGILERTDQQMAEFALQFSRRIYEVMKIRPAIYVNGNYAQNVLAGGTSAQRAELAQQPTTLPTVTSPAFPVLWNARWPNQAEPNSIDVQNLNPTEGFANIYGPWDDYGVTSPWAFWQYASTGRLQSFNNGGSNLDFDASKGDIEFVKDQLVPAVWWNDSSGDWSTLLNWNSGQPVTAQPPLAGGIAPLATGPLPTPRLPGAAGGSGPTSPQNDTVILERPSANITVTLSTGTHNIRKMYMRETLDITGGSLIINYNPNYVSDTVTYPNAVRSGPISAQFSGPVTLSGTGALSVHTLQVDATRTLTQSGGTLTINTLNLMPHASSPAKLAIGGDVTINPLSNAAAVINKGTGAGNTGVVDLSGGNREITVGNGAAAADLTVNVPVTNGGLTKVGLGTLVLNNNTNTYGGGTTVSAGTLLVNNTTGSGTGSGAVDVNAGGTLGGTGIISGAVTVNADGHVAPGASAGNLTATSSTFTSGSNFDVEIGGLAAGTQHDKLTLSGAATLAGQLNVSLISGFTPAIGNSFTILSAGGVTGQFDSLVAPSLAGAVWQLGYNPTSVTLSVAALAIPGDFNADGSVDSDDIASWGGGFGMETGGQLGDGDSDADGDVDGFDFLTWQQNFGASTGVAAAAAVPEPAALALAALAALAVIGRRKVR